MQPPAPPMFAEPWHPNPPPMVPRTGTYGLTTPQMQGAVQQMLSPTQNTLPSCGGPDDISDNLRVWDQSVEPPNVPGFSAADLEEPEVITIHNTDSKPAPPLIRWSNSRSLHQGGHFPSWQGQLSPHLRKGASTASPQMIPKWLRCLRHWY